MKTISLLVLMLFTGLQLSAQALSEKELIGNWSVVRLDPMADAPPAEVKKNMAAVLDLFVKATFHFKNDKNFSFYSPMKEMILNDEQWKLDRATGNITIQEWKDKSSEKPLLMQIKAFKRGGKTIFVIEENFCAFEVKKDS